MDSLSIVLTTVPTEEKGAEIARALVGAGLCACVNVVPGLRSIYTWKGKLEEEREALLIAKVPTSRLSDYRERMAALHPYEVPEIVAIGADSVNAPYLAWCLAR
jgi:periplasmic divalent cation tolerance protein